VFSVKKLNALSINSMTVDGGIVSAFYDLGDETIDKILMFRNSSAYDTAKLKDVADRAS
jgi:hypothetical protein